ncbi:MAG: hypothetical protein NVSMB52_01740 [Chloroflexota bacterium]
MLSDENLRTISDSLLSLLLLIGDQRGYIELMRRYGEYVEDVIEDRNSDWITRAPFSSLRYLGTSKVFELVCKRAAFTWSLQDI